MCLILFAWQVDRNYPLIVAANRDEFFNRPTSVAGFWPEATSVLAGRDLEAGGTWMGVTTAGRFAALTNVRDPEQMNKGRPSRGKLVADFLVGSQLPDLYTEQSLAFGSQCNGYNLLVGDQDSLWWSSNVSGESRKLEPGIYGLSNHSLDTPWPKVSAGKVALHEALIRTANSQDLLNLLVDPTIYRDDLLPKTGVAIEWERRLSASFIRIPSTAPSYGTRSSTAILRKLDGTMTFDEITWAIDSSVAKVTGRKLFRFQIN
jgi:uncharacterized protein with NRDE domain